ncbi:unnamed protein product [Ranitomeya imitator]|uniref:Uncharacterized protein n=1 Tax=Ranitomeya imitator TaxID=111125 RepID=A0ABN9MIW2_9NEOB|nr:unnamed protein product [Ranitomeya imitator]
MVKRNPFITANQVNKHSPGDSCAQIVLTQSPDLITVSPGETVTISCKASSNVLKATYNGTSRNQDNVQHFSSINQATDIQESQTGSLDLDLELISLLQSEERQRTMQQIITVSRVIAILLSHSDTEPYKNLLPSPIMSLYYNVV